MELTGVVHPQDVPRPVKRAVMGNLALQLSSDFEKLDRHIVARTSSRWVPAPLSNL
jgi:hypothetical protein